MTAAGSIYEGYRLLRPLGRGWLGEVYAAQNLDGAGIAALRMMAPELAAQPQVMTQFRRLHQKWERLAHPNILKVGELIEREHRLHYQMYLAQSGSVRNLLQSHSGQFLDLLVVVDVARQVASALSAAHDANLMHGDLKPENLLLSPARAILGRQAYGVSVSDFGVGELQAFTHGVHDRLIVTTPAYMSPEQCRGVRTEVRSDFYALGVILYELLTNMLPFEARDFAEAAEKHQHVAAIPPGQIRLDIPQDLEELVLSCLAKAPEYRPRSAAELEQALQRVLNGLLPQGPSPTMVLPDLPEPPAPRIEPLRDRTPYPRLQITGADGQPFRVEPLQSPVVTLGRAPGNGIVLEHAGVSRHHVSIEVEEDGVFVTDLASTNGTTLSGTALEVRTRTPWPDGSVLRIEPFWLRLQPPQKVVQQARIGVLVDDNALNLTPGEAVVLSVKLANTDRTVDHFRMEVEGVPPEWVQNLYTELQLNPGMTTETTLRVMVPRDSKFLAGSYPVQVVARSRENPAEFGRVPMTWQVLPFTETKIDLTPRRRSTWRRTHYDLKIVNASNVPVTYNPVVRDDEGMVRLQSPADMMRVPPSSDLRNIIPVRAIISNTLMRVREGIGKVNIGPMPQNVQVLPGAEYTHRIQVKVPIRWIASPRQRSLRLHPHPDVGGDHPETLSLLHLPVIPLWALPIVLILGGLFVLWLLQAPSIVTVSVVPVEAQPQTIGATGAAGSQGGNTPAGAKPGTAAPAVQTNQQPRAGQPFYLDFETRNASRIVVKPWNKTLYRGNGRLLIPEGVTQPVEAQVIVYGWVKTTQQTLTITPKLPGPVVKLFTASPENISAGQSATLRWDVSNVEEVTIDPLGTLPPKGSRQVPVKADTAFRLSAKGASGDAVDKTLTVSVLPASIDLFEVTPTQAKVGGTVTVRWKVRNAVSVTLDPLGSEDPQGSVKLPVTGDQTYTLHAKVGDQELVKVITVKALLPVAQTLSVSPQNAQVGDKVTVSWKVDNASSVILEPFGTVPASGSRQTVVTADTSFHLTARSGETVTDLGSVAVTATARPPKVTGFTADPRKPRSGEPVTLQWSSENGASAELSGLPGQGTQVVSPSGALTVKAPTDVSSLTLTVKGGDGSSVSQVLSLPVLPPKPKPAQPVASAPKPVPAAVKPAVSAPVPGKTAAAPPTLPKPVQPKPAPPRPQIVRFTVTPLSVTAGQPVKLIWATRNAAQVRIEPLGRTLPASGALTLKPGKTTIYTLTSGGVSRQTSVLVKPVITPVKPVVQPRPPAPPKPTPQAQSAQSSSGQSPSAQAKPAATAPTPAASSPTPPAPDPVINEFSVSPAQITSGDTVTVRWNVSGAKQVRITGLGVQPPKGEVTRALKYSTAFVLRVGSGTGDLQRRSAVQVVPASRAGTDARGLGGEWIHPFGSLSLTVRGNSVTGVYRNIRTGQDEQIRGSLTPNSSGSFSLSAVTSSSAGATSSDNRVSFLVVFSADRKSFTGVYTGRSTPERWCGWRPNSPPVQCGGPASSGAVRATPSDNAQLGPESFGPSKP